ncbi:MAG TPA: ATP-binding protein [Vicinamibacterales bacterium]|nr:ATP-binding protein [Vicinamibacterales bacterium]
MKLSIRMRLTLWYTALITLALAVFSLGVLWLQARWGRAQFDSELANLAATAARVVDEEFLETHNFKRAAAETRQSLNVPGVATAILDDRNAPIAAHWHGFDNTVVPALVGDRTVPAFVTVTQAHVAWRVLVTSEHAGPISYRILVAGPLDQVARQQTLLSRVLLVATPLIALMTGIVAWWVASSALRPVTTMAGQAEAITAASRQWRLDGESDADEIGQLARAFNRLLSRLGAASQTQRQFMADASHELRTPVSVIQTAAEVTLSQPGRSPDDYRDALTIVNEQGNRLSRMVQDMFVLARADVGATEITRQRLYIDDVVDECVRAAAVVANAKGIVLTSHVEPDVAVVANDDLLRQLMTNLLDNSLQYTPCGGAVEVQVATDGAEVTIAVSDTGPGIPISERERVFERFVRLDAARSATSGAGLGLAIARWIVEQHQGTIAVEGNDAGGSTFRVRIPKMNQGAL